MNRREILLAAAAGAFHARLSAQANDAPAAAPAPRGTSGDLAELTLAEASKRMLDGAVTSRDLTLACLERTAAENPPTLKASSPTIEAALQFENESRPDDRPMFSIDNTAVFNRLGLPALTVPCGFTSEGLPIGLMICGPRFSEGSLLALGAAYERATDWHKRRPARAA